MGRPKKWASEAERLAAYRAKQSVQDDGQTVRVDDEAVRIARESVRLERTDSTVNQSVDNGCIPFRHQAHVPMALFNGAGRGSPRTHTDGHAYVLVSRHAGSDLGELGIVSAHDWQGRLAQRCGHGRHGWSCHEC